MARYDTQQIGQLVRQTRKSLHLSQEDLALTSGTGVRFIIDLEKGKPSCEFNKALRVIQNLGITVSLTPPLTNTLADKR